jgi:hypothetical protein
MFAVGTFKGNRVSCYSEDTGDERVMELDLGQEGQNVEGHGITQVRLPWATLVPYSLLTIARPSSAGIPSPESIRPLLSVATIQRHKRLRHQEPIVWALLAALSSGNDAAAVGIRY